MSLVYPMDFLGAHLNLGDSPGLQVIPATALDFPDFYHQVPDWQDYFNWPFPPYPATVFRLLNQELRPTKSLNHLIILIQFLENFIG